MVVSEIVTLLFYVISIAFLPEYFGVLHSKDRQPSCRLSVNQQIFHSSSLFDLYGR